MKTPEPKRDKYLAQKEIRTVLEREVVAPFIKSVCSDIKTSINLTTALVLAIETANIVSNLPSSKIKKIKKEKEQKLFLGYFGKIYHSCLFSIGITDYLSGTILMRSLFELLVGVSSEINGPMKDRIYSISFIDEQEKKKLMKTWRMLCAWAHPYGKWEKNVCPMYYSCGRVCHPVLFKQSLELSNKILDFMLTAIFEIFNLSASNYSDSQASFMLDKFPMFYKRLGRTDAKQSLPILRKKVVLTE